FSSYLCAPRDLSSFPTRRSSDLKLLSLFRHVQIHMHALCAVHLTDDRARHDVPRGQLLRFVVALHESFEADIAQHAAFTAQRHIDRKSTRLNSSHVAISYAVFCL